MEDRQVTVLLLLDFNQACDMVIHGLLLCKLRNMHYSDGAWMMVNYSDRAQMMVDSYLNVRTQFVRCGEKKSSVGRVTCGVPQESVLGPLLMTFQWLLSTTGFIFMRMISGFITVLVFRINKGVMMRSTWIWAETESGKEPCNTDTSMQS
jgi:hypothetical protein